MQFSVRPCILFASPFFTTSSFSHEVDLTKLPLGNGKLSSAPKKTGSGPAELTRMPGALLKTGRGSNRTELMTRPPPPNLGETAARLGISEDQLREALDSSR